MLSLTLTTDPGAALRTALQTTLQTSYRKAVTAARQNKKNGKPQGLTEEQKQEIRYVHCWTRPRSVDFLSVYCLFIVTLHIFAALMFYYRYYLKIMS
jgi:hypothetical protein